MYVGTVFVRFLSASEYRDRQRAGSLYVQFRRNGTIGRILVLKDKAAFRFPVQRPHVVEMSIETGGKAYGFDPAVTAAYRPG